MNPSNRQAALDAANVEVSQLGAAIFMAIAIWLCLVAWLLLRETIDHLPARLRLWRIERAHRANLNCRPKGRPFDLPKP